MDSKSLDEILSFEDKSENLYSILECNIHSTKDQIQAEYRAKALIHHPDKNQGDYKSYKEFEKINRYN